MYRLAARALIAIFTALVFLLIQSVFWSTAISTLMAGLVVCLIALAYFRPQNALLVIAALAPLARVWSPLVSDRMRGAEVLVLAFLAGALLRGWTLHRFRNVVSSRLQIASLLFGLIVSLSCVHQLWNRSVEPRDLLEYVAQDYTASLRGYGIFGAMLLIEGIALLSYAIHYCRTQPDFTPSLVRMLVLGGIAAAVFNLWFFVHEVIETGKSNAVFWDFLINMRWSAHVSDVNAAGSFFAMILLILLGLSVIQKPPRPAWIAAALTVGLALWMTSSRTALVAAAIVGFICLTRLAIGRVRMHGRPASIPVGVASLVIVAGAQYILFKPLGAAASLALDIRWEFLKTTWRMIKAHPLFGVGIGQYPQWSAHYSSAWLIGIYPRENAHNNFAQVAGELGLVGLAAFLAVLTLCFWPPDRSRQHDPVIAAVIPGVAVFMVSWLGGHPLLVPEVAYPFWLTLAIVASGRLT